MNGARGVVIRFTEQTHSPVIRFVGGLEITMALESFSLTVQGQIVAQRLQLPLELCWGLSVHKAQGMSVDKVELYLRNVFDYGQAYGTYPSSSSPALTVCSGVVSRALVSGIAVAISFASHSNQMSYSSASLLPAIATRTSACHRKENNHIGILL